MPKDEDGGQVDQGRRRFPIGSIPKLLGAALVVSVLFLGAGASWANIPPQVQSILQTAHRLLGVPYQPGGTSPEAGFDCSGFVSFVFGQNGIELIHSSPEMFRRGRLIARHELRPGDLVFFSHDRRHSRVGHVGIYLGQGQFIHASIAANSIRVDALSDGYWAARYYGARRI